MRDNKPTPGEILIIGGGVFGISTAVALLERPQYRNTRINIVDTSSELPNQSAASWDTSRMLRADYAEAAYTKLVSEARKQWTNSDSNAWGGEGRYYDAPLLLTAQPGVLGHVDGYLERSLENLQKLAETRDFAFMPEDVKELADEDAIRAASGPIPGVSGNVGYINRNCGWVDARGCLRFLYQKLRHASKGKCKIHYGTTVCKLLYEGIAGSSINPARCIGAKTTNGSRIHADLTILAAGAWSPSLVDMQGRAEATGQILGYLTLTEEEQASLNNMPIYFNMSTGMFMFPAHNHELKLGRHGFGYQNPTPVILEGKRKLISTPISHLPVPTEAEDALRDFLVELFPHWRNKELSKTKLCWYCDTPNGDFLIDYHPDYKGLFLATGDSGHGVKVLPVIGEKIADSIEGKLDHTLQELWRWREDITAVFQGTSDGTRGGRRGMVFQEEWQKSKIRQEQ
ncbi:hypothetical protein PV08_03736 [Exophiala spinifera]|uniref:FAD dependent oxidoreductase domain-containing protein n=1 Tax=Exophiala spinifera TaxID=91928 RepID=A0A0D2BC64_9EURO|nr:uncharacterized protein PV08_03736 [Exophiala spinifera]KIW16548.1 hypothetical protein PV08_03736 [Exophiala spinifera]